MILILLDANHGDPGELVGAVSNLYVAHGRQGDRDEQLRLIVDDFGAQAVIDPGLRKFRPDGEFIAVARTIPGVLAVQSAA